MSTLDMEVEDFIKKYIDWIDKDEWEYVYEEAELHLQYPYELTSLLMKANIDPLPHMTSIPFSYAPMNIKNIIIPDKCKSIGVDAFNSCDQLTHINLPEGLAVIDSRAFYCSGLKEITLPSTLEVLGAETFKGCQNLVKIKYNGTIDQLNEVKIWEECFEDIPAVLINCIDGDIELGDVDE